MALIHPVLLCHPPGIYKGHTGGWREFTFRPPCCRHLFTSVQGHGGHFSCPSQLLSWRCHVRRLWGRHLPPNPRGVDWARLPPRMTPVLRQHQARVTLAKRISRVARVLPTAKVGRGGASKMFPQRNIPLPTPLMHLLEFLDSGCVLYVLVHVFYLY